MSWRRRLSDLSCVSSRHQHNEERRNGVQVQDETCWRDHMLEACLSYGDHGYVKMHRKRSSPIVEYGEQLARLHQASTIKKGVPSCCGQDRHHRAQVECARLRFALDRVSFLPVSCLVGRPVYRIDGRTIKRALEWVTRSYHSKGAQTFAFLHHISWLLFGSYPCGVLELVVIFMTSSSSSKTDFAWETCCIFQVGGFTGLYFIDRSNISSFVSILPC